ncbi:uncharacterized protein LOC34620823 [Cyclospora cayetanensis]|uniref:Uncharacterized protein LOC34620823 n=1 Tax=Cyclospora cayetanensis TaxID=88456 RepID=A0A6P6RXY6_9EIME|nr:uncharacterized protein LOC34620823 [Cyclospora cayetanensis]
MRLLPLLHVASQSGLPPFAMFPHRRTSVPPSRAFSSRTLLLPLLLALCLTHLARILAGDVLGNQAPEEGLDADDAHPRRPPKSGAPDGGGVESANDQQSEGPKKALWGVPVPSVFQVAAGDLQATFPVDRSSKRSTTHASFSWPGATSPGASIRPNGELPATTASPPFGGFPQVALLQLPDASVYKRVNASFNSVLVLTDVDDTLWSSGAATVFGNHLGGVDNQLARGLPYPGIGTLLYFLALGPHTSTPSGLRIPLADCPFRQLSQTENCPVEVSGTPKLPRRPGVLSARVSTPVVAKVTRPRSFRSDVETILTAGPRHIYSSAVDRWPVGFQNNMSFTSMLTGQHARGIAKVAGFVDALGQGGGPAVLVGDTGEKDPEATAAMALMHSDSLVAVLLHSVFSHRYEELMSPASPGSAQPRAVLGACLPVLSASGRQTPALQLAYRVLAGVKNLAVNSAADLDPEVAYAAGAQMSAEMRRIFAAATRSHLLAAEAVGRGETVTHPPPPCIVFLHVEQLDTEVVRESRPAGMGSQVAKLTSWFASKVVSWTSRKLHSNQEDLDRQGRDCQCSTFQQQAVVQPLSLRALVHGVTSHGTIYPAGVPFGSYRTVVGAGLAAWTLGIITTQDVLSLVVATVRDFRSLGPPIHCWQRTLVLDMLVDVLVSFALSVSQSVEYYVGALGSRTDLRDHAVYKDAVDALWAFADFQRKHCNRLEEEVLALDSCLEELGRGIAQYAAAKGDSTLTDQLLPLLGLVCRYKDQMEHWLSAGAEEVESFSFILGRALTIGVLGSSRLYTETRGQQQVQQQRGPQQVQQQRGQQQVQQQHQGQAQTQHLLEDASFRKLQRDAALLPELAVELHVGPNDAPATLSRALQQNAIDVQTVEDLQPFIDEILPREIPSADLPRPPQEVGARNLQALRSRSIGSNSSSSNDAEKVLTGGKEEDDADLQPPGSCSHFKSGPVCAWLNNLRAYCKSPANAIGEKACSTLKWWLFGFEGREGFNSTGAESSQLRGALVGLVRVAEYNVQNLQGVLDIPGLGIVLEPFSMRPGTQQTHLGAVDGDGGGWLGWRWGVDEGPLVVRICAFFLQ